MRPAFLAMTGLLGFLGLAALPGIGLAQNDTAELLAQSDIVFAGTVSEVGAASFAQVPASEGNLVVEVDAVYLAPAALALATGDRVTVALKEPGSLSQGARATFFATGWILGEGVAVREVGHRLVAAAGEAGGTGEAGAAPVEMKPADMQRAEEMVADARLSQRLASADMVVVGRVVAVRAGSQEAFLQNQATRITEHDPEWREAVIAVESGLKGASAGQEVVVRFPASIDIRWYAVPKLQEGQEGTFILQRDAVSGAPLAKLGGAEVPAYTALKAQDVLPMAEAPKVRALMAE